jgi:hypothetical protein
MTADGQRDLDDIEYTLKRDCSKFLRLLKTQKVLMRAVGGSPPDRGLKSKKGYMTERAPKDMPTFLHDYMNAQMKKKAGWPVRNGISVSTTQMQTGNYGHTYMFLPVGNFKWAFLDGVYDLYGKLNSGLRGAIQGMQATVGLKGWKEDWMTPELWDVVDSWTTDRLKVNKPWNDHMGEIMFNVKEYLLFDFMKYKADDVKELFEKLGIPKRSTREMPGVEWQR